MMACISTLQEWRKSCMCPYPVIKLELAEGRIVSNLSCLLTSDLLQGGVPCNVTIVNNFIIDSPCSLPGKSSL